MLAFGIILSILLQFSAAIIAFSLIRQTKFNISWILISIAFLCMTINLCFELSSILFHELSHKILIINNVLSITISLLIFTGVVFIKKIFNLQKRIDELRKQSENRVLNAIIITEERERQRFAKDLHDGLGPLLSMMKMSVSALLKSEMKTQDKEIISNIDTLITESIASIKDVSNNLSPHILDNFGLTSAINSFVAKIEKNHNISISVQSNKPDHRFEYNKEVVIYRVLLELITNTIKHADAKNIDITIAFLPGHVHIAYKDDGKGFDMEKTMQHSTGMGLSNIFSRINSIHGHIDIESKQMDGILVIIDLNI